MQKETIYYLSHILTQSPINWPAVEKEAFAIFYALKKFDQYLPDSEFVIRTYHKSLKILMNLPLRTRRFSTEPQISGVKITKFNILMARKIFMMVCSHSHP